MPITYALLITVLCVQFVLSKTEAAPENCAWSRKYGQQRAEFEAAGHWGFVILPPKDKRRKNMPWVWYAPAFKGGHPNESNGWICERLLAKGIAVCGVDIGESYGNPAGRAAFTEFHKFVIKEFDIEKKTSLWAQSRGGLMLFNWAAEHPDMVKRIAATYPVLDMRTYPGLATAAPAYGITESELESHLSEHNPVERIAPIAAKKVPILIIHGDSDTVVPIEPNSAKFTRRYLTLGGPIEMIVVKGKGHAEIPEFFERQEMVDFFVGKRDR